jgi:hypothetical protein
MPTFLVELYVARGDDAAVARGVELARGAAARLTSADTPVRLVRSIFVPADETCFFLFEADDADAAQEAAGASGLPLERPVTAAAETT